MPAEVFVSHNVASAKDYAESLRNELQNKVACEVFICEEIIPGSNFREKIDENAMNCKIMIILLNESWSKSEQCLYEFQLAHESYLTDKSPYLIPIVFNGFQWINKSHQRALSIKLTLHCFLADKVFENLDSFCNVIMKQLKTKDDIIRFYCEKCNELLKEPVILNCFHRFCNSCVASDSKCVKCERDVKEKNDDNATKLEIEIFDKIDPELQTLFTDLHLSQECQSIVIKHGYDSPAKFFLMNADTIETFSIKPADKSLLKEIIKKFSSEDFKLFIYAEKMSNELYFKDILVDVLPMSNFLFFQRETARLERFIEKMKSYAEFLSCDAHVIQLTHIVNVLIQAGDYDGGLTIIKRLDDPSLELRLYEICCLHGKSKLAGSILDLPFKFYLDIIQNCDLLLGTFTKQLTNNEKCRLNLYKISMYKKLFIEKKNVKQYKEKALKCMDDAVKLGLNYMYLEALQFQGGLNGALGKGKVAVNDLTNALKYALAHYGDVCEPLIRIYFDLCLEYLHRIKDNKKAYRCLRMSWKLSASIYGVYHSVTVKIDKMLTQQPFKKIAAQNKDGHPPDLDPDSCKSEMQLLNSSLL